MSESNNYELAAIKGLCDYLLRFVGCDSYSSVCRGMHTHAYIAQFKSAGMMTELCVQTKFHTSAFE